MQHTVLPALLVPHGALRFLALAALGGNVLRVTRSYLLLAVAAVAMLVVGSILLLRKSRREVAEPSGVAAAAIPPPMPGEEAEEDPLLGIASRGRLEQRLGEEWRRERRSGEPTALLIIAVDDFLALDEHGGPLAGDVALLTLARSLMRMLPRRADLLARYGASSFAVVLPGTDLPGTLRVAARLRWAIVRLGIAHPRAESGLVSVSLGIAVQHGLLGCGSEALLAAAEAALAKAQSLGPDRLEYTVLEGKDRQEAQSQPLLALPSIRAWTPERDGLQQSPQG